MANGWIGVDLDGTLAHLDVKPIPQWDGSIGAPIGPMVTRVKQWLEEGHDVRIVTARVTEVSGVTDGPRSVAAQRDVIRRWCVQHLGCELPITATKDYDMLELWDDRAVQVIQNTGFSVNDMFTRILREVLRAN